jgi:hypothetical protein
LWKNIVNIQNDISIDHKDKFIKCLPFKASLNKGFNNTFKTLFPNIIPVSRTIQKNITINPNWLSGFSAGDGSFLIVIRKNENCIIGYQVQAVFNIGQHIRDKCI